MCINAKHAPPKWRLDGAAHANVFPFDGRSASADFLGEDYDMQARSALILVLLLVTSALAVP